MCRALRTTQSRWLYHRAIQRSGGLRGRAITRSSFATMARQMRATGLMPLYTLLASPHDASALIRAADKYRAALVYPIHTQHDIQNFYSAGSMRVMSSSSHKHPSWRRSRLYLRRLRSLLHNRRLYASQQLCTRNLDYACQKYDERRELLQRGILYTLLDKLVPHPWSLRSLEELLQHLDEPQPPPHWLGLMCAAAGNLRRQQLRPAFSR